MAMAPSNVRFRGQSGKHLLTSSLSAFDPTETWSAQDFRSAKALLVLSLKRRGRVAWQSTSHGENSLARWPVLAVTAAATDVH
jgi:hypothetical protein